MPVRVSAHFRAVLTALLVTFLWSTSWVLIKFGLEALPALTFAGLRYGLAFLALLPLALRPTERRQIAQLPGRAWLQLGALGLLYYALTMGAQFMALQYLPAITNSLLLSFSSIIVAVLGIFFLNEHPSRVQWFGMTLYLAGVFFYFMPQRLPPGQALGFLIAGVGVLGNAFSALLGRAVNRAENLSPSAVTVISMGIGAVLLLVTGVVFQGLPRISLAAWGMVLWLALVNSALAFPLWNASLRILSAAESSLINNTMLFQIAILAWVFLGERLSAAGIAGMLLAVAGVLLVQLRGHPRGAGRLAGGRKP
jgi:drug/metabolite transporter (DMT)-like permease